MPAASSNGAVSTGGVNGGENVNGNSKNANNFPPPKNDKPRPHVCGTCQRSFARLEHLKRHERSHTKEKPFECPECTRCFARRDLLLRHQQKLHMTTTPSRPRNRRESATSSTVAGPARVRKGSLATNGHGPTTMRPRANTISHVDGSHVHLLAATSEAAARNNMAPGHSRHPSLVGLPMHNDYYFGGMSAALGHRGTNHGLPKLDTQGFNGEFGGGLRTAPVAGGFNADFDFEGLLFGPGSTINPNALHYYDSPQSMAMDASSPYHQAFPDMSASQSLEENFDWLNGFEHQMPFNHANEQAIDESSPSAISTASQSGISEVMLDGSNNPAVTAVTTASVWPQSMMAPPLITPNPFTLDLGNPSFNTTNGGPVSPHSLQQKSANDPYFASPPTMNSMSPSMMTGQAHNFHPPININPENPMSTITDSTRQALLTALAQCPTFGGGLYPATNSPLSGRSNSFSDTARNFPSTHDLQRFIQAYINCFHPHLPFLHIPTLSFDVPTFLEQSQNNGQGNSDLVGGGRGCLILSMAAIGALYEMEHVQSKALFDCAKKMIQLYLEERRKSDLRDHRKADSRETSVLTPLWLVQALLLNVCYGNCSGEKTTSGIASTHCAALVSLARAANLLRPVQRQDIHMMDDTMVVDAYGNGMKQEISDQHQEWYSWKVKEERKRTLYAVYIMSSLLVSAFNHTPTLTNSEIMLGLPCDEEFWAAENANIFYAKGGAEMAAQHEVTFHHALGELLRTSEKQQNHMMQGQMFGGSQEMPKSDLKPSTFGCLVLINALHNDIWETRQRHHSKVWTNKDTETMIGHIEPALRAWQAAWGSNPHHSLERPNPFGLGSMLADSFALLDLSYVRLFVDFSRSKEKFWQRDFDGMAAELACGSELFQHTENSPSSGTDSTEVSETSATSSVFVDSPPTSTSSPQFANNGFSINASQQAPNHSASKREKLLRKAAFYAADSLSMSDKLGMTFTELTSHELPLQSAMCAFDCAQVLAEWVTAVQERVGRYLGILGRDEIDLSQVPSIMLLEEEDCTLLNKIQEVLNDSEAKVNYDLAGTGNVAAIHGSEGSGYGSRILRTTAYMLDKAAVWPVTHLMARSLEIHANHMRARAENSVAHRD